MNLVTQQVKRVNVTVKMSDSPFHLLCMTRFVFQEKLSRANVHLCNWPVCKIKCNSEIRSWIKTSGHCHRDNRLAHYHSGSKSLLQQTALNSKPLMLSETEGEVQETSSYSPRPNTILLMPQRHKTLVLLRPMKLQVMPVMKVKKKNTHVYLHFCTHHEDQ